ncbi:MAG: hypothetical protein WA584_16195 [Pyrinomonadaceae bacterium]
MKRNNYLRFAAAVIFGVCVGAFVPAAGQRNTVLVKQFIDEVAQPYRVQVDRFKDLDSANQGFAAQAEANRKVGYLRISDDTKRLMFFNDLPKLAIAADLCKTKFANLNPKDLSYYDVKGICRTAVEAQTIYNTGVQNYLQFGVLQGAGYLDEQKRTLVAKDGFLTHPWATKYILNTEKAKAEIREKKAAEYKAAGAEFPADYFAPLDAKASELWAEIERLAPNYALPAKSGNDAAIETMAKKVLMKDAGIKILRTGMTETTWKITTNNLGIPTYRSKYGFVFYKMPASFGENLCRYRAFNYNEQYAGGGTYTKNSKVDFSESVRLQKCQ